MKNFRAPGVLSPPTATAQFKSRGKQIPSKDERGDLKESSTANTMRVRSNLLQDLAQVVVNRGCAELENHKQSTCHHNGTGPLSIPATGATSQNTSRTTDTQAHMERETTPTSISPVDLDDSFCKDTDTVMGVYGSDSIHSSNSDDSTGFFLRGMASPEKVDTVLVKGIGSHFVQGNAGSSPEAQFHGLSPAQYGGNSGFSEPLGRKYGEDLDVSTSQSQAHIKIAPMCFPEATEDQRVSILCPPQESAIARRHVLDNLYSLDLITRGTEEHSCQLSSPSITQGRKKARNMSVAQDDLERQQPLDAPNKGRIRAARSPIKRFIVCALGMAVLFMFYARFQVT
jgi:hypothetical protein